MDFVDKPRGRRQASPERPVSPYLERPLRSLEEALTEIETRDIGEPLDGSTWDAAQARRGHGES